MSTQDNHENEDSVINEEAEETAESTEEEAEEKSEEEAEEEKNEDEEEKDEESDEEESSKYRPKSEEKPKDTVPLKTFLELKKDYKKLEKELGKDGEDLSTKDLESLAEEYNIEPKILKVIVKAASTMTLKEAQKMIAPLKAKEIEAENTKAFESDFEKSILSKYPHLASKKEQFKNIAFSPDFVHLKNLEDIRKEFFADVEPQKKREKDSPEGGSRGAIKGDEEIDFDNMTEEQHARVINDPNLRKKYYAHQDAQGL